jgi:lysylphosphatidylglycerol synthetase-like protein (DUF2156 family)
MAAVVIVVRTVLGIGLFVWPTQGSVMKLISLLIVILVALIWTAFDSREEAYRVAEPEDRGDLTMLWLKAAITAGVISGAVCWVLKFVVPGIGTNPLWFELTVGAAFITLLISLPAVFGLLIGRVLGDRKRHKEHPTEEEEFHQRLVESHRHHDDAPAGATSTGAAGAGAAGAGAAGATSSTLTMSKDRDDTGAQEEYYEEEEDYYRGEGDTKRP